MNIKKYSKISIITPSFNQGKFIEKSILSVLNQNYPNLEYIIIDGGSTDDTLSIIKKYEKYISYWVSEKDRGQSEAINKGFNVATGEIIAWLNSDDLYCNNVLEEISKVFTQHTDVDIVYGDVINFSESGKESYVRNQFELYDFFSRVSIHQPSVFWRRKIMDEVGLLNENLHYCMDYDFWMRLFLNYKSLKIDMVLSRFREHGQSKTNSNPLSLYNEYQNIISVFFNSVSNSSFINKLIEYNIYFNSANSKYAIKYHFTDTELQKLFFIFIERCINIEYTKNNYKGVIFLFMKEPRLFLKFKNILFFVKSFLLLFMRKIVK